MSASIESPGQEPLTTIKHPLLLFFDGECAFCNRWVARVKDADKARRTRFATKQGLTFQRVAQAHPELAGIDSIVLAVRNGEGGNDFLVRSAAIRTVLDGLPGFRFFAGVLHLVPIPISNIGYRLFSKVRTPLFGKWHHCRVPLEEDRDLYLD
jgi:predicted DCC family thiol-disulfide oxidoreductase YuxK